MIKSFDLKRFRCFEHLHLKDLRRINIFLGDNGAGKTALGEAIFIAAAAHPSAAWFVRTARARLVPVQAGVWNREFFETFWEDLFYGLDQTKPITAIVEDSFRGKQTVTIDYLKEEGRPTPAGQAQIPPLAFTRQSGTGARSIATIKIDDKNAPVYEGVSESIPVAYALPSTLQFNITDMVNYFSDIARSKNETPIVEALATQFHGNITELLILLDATFPSIFASTPSATKRLPLSVVSAGAARYLNILLAIAKVPRGIVLVDEIENGIYYEKFPVIWQTLRKNCFENETQLFASTHSYECLQALLPAMQDHRGDFSFIRLERKAEKVVAKQFWGEDIERVLKIRGEIR